MKQVDFAVRVATFSAGGLNGSYTANQMVEVMKKEYPFSDGWQLDKVEHVQLTVDGETVLLAFTRWTDDTVSTKAK